MRERIGKLKRPNILFFSEGDNGASPQPKERCVESVGESVDLERLGRRQEAANTSTERNLELK